MPQDPGADLSSMRAATWQQAIARANVLQDLWRHMASLGNTEFKFHKNESHTFR